LAHDGHDGAGTLTTCVGELSGATGLAIVRRGVATSGTLLHTADGIAARVVSGPLGDDPGVAGKRA
ncbi:MAG TPA: hypothetical protein VG755_18810, partial [Nannocystaceae bacterium]|nr:hypothetical protein [Nannocystaceae bacterium]